jgi:hypothetical protein
MICCDCLATIRRNLIVCVIHWDFSLASIHELNTYRVNEAGARSVTLFGHYCKFAIHSIYQDVTKLLYIKVYHSPTDIVIIIQSQVQYFFHS